MGDAMPAEPHRSGFVAIIGRPNVGKSTLLNRIMGEKIAITSDKPQTTRNRIQGIHNLPDGQMVFIDTPGLHQARSPLNRYMQESALDALKGADIVIFLVDAQTPPARDKGYICELLAGVTVPLFLAINKTDRVEPPQLLGTIAGYAEYGIFKEIFPVSALTGNGVERLLTTVSGYLPEGPPYFPDDILTDLPERFIVAEYIREKVLHLTHQEVPHSVAVVIDSFTERHDGLISITATINVERDSQKGIIIGQRGAMLKKIGTLARRDMERFFASRVYLELFVRVSREWSEKSQMLKEFGYQ
jgi:GTP-binding protein Era